MNDLEKFKNLCEKSTLISPLEAHYTYEYRFSPKAMTLSLSAIIHGNEIIGLDIFISLIQKIINNSISPKINIKFIIGNIEAYQVGKRFLETDMNRSFLTNQIVTDEEKRADKIYQLIDDSSLFIDIHQTIEPSLTAFMVFSFSENNYRFARAIHSDLPIVTYKNSGYIGKGIPFSAAAAAKGIPAITVETGEKGKNESQKKLGEQLILRAIDLLEKETDFFKNMIEFKNTYTWGHTITNPDFSLELVKRFTNFQLIEAGEVIARNNHTEVRASNKGVALFPKYGEQRLKSPELIRILHPVTSVDELK